MIGLVLLALYLGSQSIVWHWVRRGGKGSLEEL